MGAAAAPVLYGLHRLVSGGSGNGFFSNPMVDQLKASAAARAAAAVAPPIPTLTADAAQQAAQAAALAARRRAAGANGRAATLLTGGAGLVNEPAPQRATLLGA